MNETNKTNKNPVGRPRKSPKGGTMVAIWIPIELREQLRKLGGSKWVTEQLQKSLDE